MVIYSKINEEAKVMTQIFYYRILHRFTKLRSILLYSFLVGLSISCQAPKTENQNEKEVEHIPNKRFEYVLDMVHDNPGESKTATKYNDPAFLKAFGVNGMVPHLHIQTALSYTSIDSTLFVDKPNQLAWITNKKDWVAEKLQAAEQENIDVYPFTDFLVLPRILLEKYKEEMVQDEFLKPSEFESEIEAIKGKLPPDINKPMTQKVIRAQLHELFEKFPSLDGIAVRFGETYLFDTPHHTGGSPLARGGEQGIKDHITFINILREEVCEKRNKKIFYRTWDFGFFHEQPEAYLAITNQIEPHPNLTFSIKHPKGDFHRMLPFNPTIGIGKHNYIIEVQAQHEYYGKGAHPYYVGKGVLEGFEEFELLMKPNDKQSLTDLLDDANFKGVWTWSRGGGWHGPYIKNELWLDLNTYVISKWAQDPSKTEAQLFQEFTESKGLKGENSKHFREIALLSSAGALRGHMSLAAPFNLGMMWWIRDNYMSGKILSDYMKEVIKKQKVEEVIKEKQESVQMWKKIEALAKQVEWDDKENKKYLMVSASYGRIKYEIIEKTWTVILLGLVGDETGTYDKERIQAAILAYDQLWEEWKTLKAENPSCATIYEPHAWAINFDGVYPDEETGVASIINKYRAF